MALRRCPLAMSNRPWAGVALVDDDDFMFKPLGASPVAGACAQRNMSCLAKEEGMVLNARINEDDGPEPEPDQRPKP